MPATHSSTRQIVARTRERPPEARNERLHISPERIVSMQWRPCLDRALVSARDGAVILKRQQGASACDAGTAAAGAWRVLDASEMSILQGVRQPCPGPYRPIEHHSVPDPLRELFHLRPSDGRECLSQKAWRTDAASAICPGSARRTESPPRVVYTRLSPRAGMERLAKRTLQEASKPISEAASMRRN